MTRALGVSEAEWEALYRRLERPLYNLAYRYVWNSQEAQDILHDAFMALWARRDRLLPSTADRYSCDDPVTVGAPTVQLPPLESVTELASPVSVS